MANPDSFQNIQESEIGEASDEVRVLKEEASAGDVKEYEFQSISRPGAGNYDENRKKFGSLAATDPKPEVVKKRDTRFEISEVFRDPLGIEDEERRAIDERVKEAIKSVEDEVRKKGYDEGFEKGSKDGYSDAFKKFQAEAADRAEKIDLLIESFENAKSHIFKNNERLFIESVYAVAKKVMLRELAVDEGYIARLGKELIERVGVKDNVILKVNPDDAKNIEMLKGKLSEAIINLKNLTIEPSEEIRGGGCRVESQWNAIDASIGVQLDKIYEGMTGEKRDEEVNAQKQMDKKEDNDESSEDGVESSNSTDTNDAGGNEES